MQLIKARFQAKKCGHFLGKHEPFRLSPVTYLHFNCFWHHTKCGCKEKRKAKVWQMNPAFSARIAVPSALMPTYEFIINPLLIKLHRYVQM